MAGYGHPYEHGSNAVLLTDDFPAAERRRRERQPVRQPASKTNVKPVVKTNAKKAVRPQVRRKGVFSTLFVIVSCFAIFAFIIARYSIICSTGNDIADLKSQIKKMQTEASNYQVQISEKMDMANIQDVASEKLNMGFPNANQIVYVDLENENADMTVQNGENQFSKGDEKNINVLSEIINALE